LVMNCPKAHVCLLFRRGSAARKTSGRLDSRRWEIVISSYEIGAIVNFVACACIAIAFCAYYFLFVFPLKRRTPEQAVQYMSSHGRTRYRNDDVRAFARSQRERENKSISAHFRTHVFLTVLLVVGIVVIAVIAATKSSQQPSEVLSYISEIVLILVIIAFGWLIYLFRRRRIKIYDRFLGEQTEKGD